MIDFRPVDQIKIVSGTDDAGGRIFSVLVKRTYDILLGKPLVLSLQPMPFVEIDQYYDHGDARTGTVRLESDLVPFKAATDVVFVGDAHAPDGAPVETLDAVIKVNDFKKTIRVIGDRRCIFRENKAPEFTEPEAFIRMPIRYERAYGGWDRESNPDLPFGYPRNPMGTGLAIENRAEVIDGLRLPNLEDPEDLLTPERVVLGNINQWNGQPIPQGFGWFHKTWYPRCSHVGAFPGYVDVDEIMREEESGMVPEGQSALARQFKLPAFDIRFNNGASPGLALPYLAGNETITLINLTPEQSHLEFDLPGKSPDDIPVIMMDIGLGENLLEPVLHTVCIRAEQMRVDLVWRGAHSYPGIQWLPEMKKMNVRVT